MLTLLFAWIIIAFVLITFGDIFLTIYNKWCRQDEQYSIFDKLFLGLCPVSALVAIWSLWLPSNYIFLAICLAVCIIYIVWNRKRFTDRVSQLKIRLKGLPVKGIVMLCLFALIILFAASWIEGIDDSIYYHYQNIRWNEEYAVVPGLGNLEDKFAFNSNFFLLCSIFTFRFLFNEALYPLTPFFFVAAGVWVMCELFGSGYELKRVIISISFILLFLIGLPSLLNTSTDVLPNLLVFYIVCKTILYPGSLRSNRLLFFMLPVFMITGKISVFPFCLFSLYILYLFIKDKQYKPLSFTVSMALIIIIPWLVRNVIVSGYLVYPVYSIDLFSFDWKIPHDVAVKAKDYVNYVGHEFFSLLIKNWRLLSGFQLFIALLKLSMYCLIIISFLTIIVNTIHKKRNIPFPYYLSAAVLTVTLIIWILNGPDIRFVTGAICAYIAVAVSLFINKAKSVHVPRPGLLSAIFLIAVIFLWSSNKAYHSYKLVARSAPQGEVRGYSSILYRPYVNESIFRLINPELDSYFMPYEINNGIIIYISYLNATLERLPATVNHHRGKFTDYKCLEARGKSLQEGFRTKEGCR